MDDQNRIMDGSELTNLDDDLLDSNVIQQQQLLQSQMQHQHLQQIHRFWQCQLQEIDELSSFKGKSGLPLARIKRIMKFDEDVKMISAEAPVLFAKACEVFILELTLRAWIHTEENKRRTLQRNDLAMAISRNDTFDFLIDIVPRDESLKKRQGEELARQTVMAPELQQYYFQLAQQQQQAMFAQQAPADTRPLDPQMTQLLYQSQSLRLFQQAQYMQQLQMQSQQLCGLGEDLDDDGLQMSDQMDHMGEIRDQMSLQQPEEGVGMVGEIHEEDELSSQAASHMAAIGLEHNTQHNHNQSVNELPSMNMGHNVGMESRTIEQQQQLERQQQLQRHLEHNVNIGGYP
eukprot:CAMPEP_0174252042 /NCGR_PEP_ID=MMETSP0439-20130205/1680_1 /TAXON_ID=0 /ORGANISM="Stereomyxa ramosa, Strain Chinc5" /LENGTH=345 /DNA_ID=CAMNT_0015332521 /DNA_START=95 /DNA_END=1132 /DNA_ORIENTATION=-